MENTIDLLRIVKKLIKRIWLIIIVTGVSGLIGVIYTFGETTNIYGAEVSIYSVAAGSYSASIQGFNAMTDYAEIVGSKKVADRVVNALPEYRLDAQKVQSMVKTSYGDNSAIFHVYAYSSNPQLATSVANAAAEAFVLEVGNITGVDNVKILDEAMNVFISYDGQKEQLKTRLIFTGAGLVLICVLLSLTEIFSTRVTKVTDCTLNGEIKLLGVIPKHNI